MYHQSERPHIDARMFVHRLGYAAGGLVIVVRVALYLFQRGLDGEP